LNHFTLSFLVITLSALTWQITTGQCLFFNSFEKGHFFIGGFWRWVFEVEKIAVFASNGEGVFIHNSDYLTNSMGDVKTMVV